MVWIQKETVRVISLKFYNYKAEQYFIKKCGSGIYKKIWVSGQCYVIADNKQVS